MRIPVSWLAEHLELPADTTAETLADAFVRIGLEVEEVTHLAQVSGPLVVGRVAEIEELTGFKKPIRYCRVEVGEDEDGERRTQGIVCGARNFSEGALVVVALPGAVLPGDFAIAERKTYGRLSQGMICSAKELGIGEDHDGILVLPAGVADPGTDATELVGLDDAVIELAITPDRGYCFSVRGLARELSNALDVPFGDPAARQVPEDERPSREVRIEDPSACSRFVFRRVTGVDPTAPTPWWMRRRLALAGIRSISLSVDVTNYVMLELGQPLHAWDATKLTGDVVVRRAAAGEKLTTLDGVERELDPDDVVICDESGPVSLAGVMGGASTEIGQDTHDVLLEAANWDPASIARAIRRHKLPSEAGRRFERTVDPAVAPVATEMAAQLLVRYGEGTLIGYRWYDTRELPVSYPFGHGLTYTTFEHRDLAVRVLDDGPQPSVEAEVTVVNTGSRAGDEVVQLYVTDPVSSARRPAQELKAFRKVHLEPGARERVSLHLDSRAFAYWHPRLRRWAVEGGEFELRVGASSRDIRQRAVVSLTGEDISGMLTPASDVGEWLDHPVLGPKLQEALGGGPLSGLFADPQHAMMVRSIPVERLSRFPGFPVSEAALHEWAAQAHDAQR